MTMANRFAKFFSTLLAVWLVATLGLVLVLRFVPITWTPLMLLRQVEAWADGKSYTAHQHWVPIEDMSPNIIATVTDAEDADFYHHRGFDLDAICAAYQLNKQCGHIVRGGSTISQQTAKNVFCTPARTWTRKAFEAYFTVLIELLWGKDRILEVYLNVIEMGDGIYGIDAAAMAYCCSSARCLTSSQSHYLAYIIPNPRIYSPVEMYVFDDFEE